MKINRTMIVSAAALALAAALPVHADHPPPPRTVSASGEGEVSIKPDRARLNVSVFQVSPDLVAAQTQVNKVVRAYLAELKALDTKEKDIATTGLTIQPEYVWDEKARTQKLTGYRVTRDIDVLIENLDKLGDYLLRATKVGINQVQPPQLEYSKAKEIQQQAMVLAAKEAQVKAKLLAEALGARLGPVRTISALDAGRPQPMPKLQSMRAEAASFDSGNAEMGISAGEIRYSSTVSVEFDLLPP